jgi:uncharacterized surface protein with fasciclin (FAS1) repeats
VQLSEGVSDVHYAAVPRAVALALPITLGAWTVQAADIIQTAERDGRFNGFLHLLEAAGMVEVLKGEGPFTVFAPIDDALGQLPPGVLEGVLAEENGNVLQTIVQSHIVPGAALLAKDLLDHEVEVETLGGAMLAVGGTAGVILVLPLEATITEVNGRAEPKSEAILASAVVEAPQGAVAGAGRPAMPAEHELTGVAMVVEPDIAAENGVIHGIDLALLPPEALRSF